MQLQTVVGGHLDFNVQLCLAQQTGSYLFADLYSVCVYFVAMQVCIHPCRNTLITTDSLTHMALIRLCWVMLSDNH